MQLYDYQAECVSRIRKQFAERKKKVLFVLPTAGGKTQIFSYIARSAMGKGKRILICAHRKELIDQISRTLWNWEADHGIITPDQLMNPGKLIQVASLQTMGNRLKYLKPPDMIIFDEAHRSVTKSYTKLLDHWPKAILLGVTATPERSDGRGMNEIYDVMVEGPKPSQLIAMDRLTPPKFFIPDNGGLDLSGLKKSGRDYDLDELDEFMKSKTIVGDAVDHYRKLSNGKPVLVFCPGVKTASVSAEKFRQAGYNFCCVHGGSSTEERMRAFKGISDGSLHGICGCDIFTEGTDIPGLHAAILLRHTKSVPLLMQIIGRVLRKSEGKTVATIIDCVGNCERLLSVDAHGKLSLDREWSLEGNKKELDPDRIAPLRRCEQCYGPMPVAKMVCPSCGHEKMKKPRGSKAKVVDGDLVDSESINLKKPARRAGLDELSAYGRAKGYKPGWALHMWRARKKKRGQQ